MNNLQIIEYQADNFFSFEYLMNGLELKKLREAKGVSQKDLANATGIPIGTIGRLESTGGDIKKIDTLNALKKYFNIEEAYTPRKEYSAAEDVTFPPFGDDRYIDRNLSMIENLEKVINFKKEGLITEEEFVRIKNKIIPKS